MQKKNLLCYVIFTAVIFLSGCITRFSVVKDNPSSPSLSGYKSIYISWIDLNEEGWSTCGYESKAVWAAEIKKHNLQGLQEYFKADLPGKAIYGAASKSETYSGKGDLILKFKSVKVDDRTGAFKDTFFSTDVDFIDGKSGKILYTASITTSSFAPFPRNWKGNTFDGRLDNQLYNLSWGISEKLR